MEDQRKVNCFYELAKNAVTGKGTLTLSKRPGVTIYATSIGTTGQTAYLSQWTSIGNIVFNKSGSDSRCSSDITASNRTILTDASYFPSFSDLTAVSNVQNVVVQLTTVVTTTQRVFFATAFDAVNANAWTEITDPQFPIPVGKMEFMDGFAFALSSDNLIWNSDSNSLANWTGTSFLAKQVMQDLPVGLARLSNKLIAFGHESVECFYNAGNTVGSPLGRIPQLHTKVGLVITGNAGVTSGSHYYCTIKEAIYFVGRVGHGNNCGLYVFDGQNFIKLSSAYIDKILVEKSSGGIYSVNAVGVNGQTMVGIGFTAAGTSPQRFLIYSPEWKEWFEWTSDIFAPVNSGKYFLGLGSNGHRVYSFESSDIWQDNAVSYPWSTQFKLPTNGSSLKRMAMYGVDADTDTSASTISVEFSDNDCQSFYSAQPIDLTWDRKVNFRGGAYTKRHIRLSATDARPKRIHNFIANVID
jgi:hypothetical protein